MINIFRTHYSIGRGIIQANDYSDKLKVPNLVNICKNHNISQCYVADFSMAGFWPIYNSLSKEGVSLVFGLICEFVSNASEQSNTSCHRNIIFVKNEAGYKKLIRISTKANTDFFYEFPRLDYNYLRSQWSDDLVLGVPFYDGFIARNYLRTESCVPEFGAIKPVLFYEDNGLPFDAALKAKTLEYCDASGYEVVESQMVYYEKPEHALALLARKCMVRSGGKQKTIERPELAHFGSNQFFPK